MRILAVMCIVVSIPLLPVLFIFWFTKLAPQWMHPERADHSTWIDDQGTDQFADAEYEDDATFDMESLAAWPQRRNALLETHEAVRFQSSSSEPAKITAKRPLQPSQTRTDNRV